MDDDDDEDDSEEDELASGRKAKDADDDGVPHFALLQGNPTPSQHFT